MCFCNWDGGWAVIPCLLLWWCCEMSSASWYQRSIWVIWQWSWSCLWWLRWVSSAYGYQRSIWVMTRIVAVMLIFMVSKDMFAPVGTLLGVIYLWVLMLQNVKRYRYRYFFGTKFFQYRFRDFFPLPNSTDTGSETFCRYQFFQIPVPRLFPVPICSDTTKKMKNSRYREFPVPVRHTLVPNDKKKSPNLECTGQI